MLADSSTGDSLALDFDLPGLDFKLREDYVPGTTISGSSNWLGKSLADLGFSSTARVEVVIKGPLGEKIVYFGKPPIPVDASNAAAKSALLKKIKKLKKKAKNAKRKKQVAKAKKFKKQIKKLTKQLRTL